ncbi:MAG: sugar porter family MFS transporter [Cyclobacteriaceae bacterium]
MQDNINYKYIYLISSVAALGGLLFGYDTAVIAGAIGLLRTKFDLSAAMMGWAASSAIIGSVFGAMVAGKISDIFGRKRTLLATAVLFAISAIGSAIPDNLTQFAIARFIGGLGVGAASMLSPLYISEIAPAKIRGTLVTTYQLAIVIGIQLIYFVNLKISGFGDEAWNTEMGWRYMLGSEAIPAILFLVLLFIVPESPRWLSKNGREEESLAILNKVNGSARAAEIQKEITETLKEEEGTLSELFAPGLRMAVLVGVFLAIFSQVTGINAIMYYAPEIFKSVGFGTESALLQTVIIGSFNVIFTFVAIWLIDKAGRKTLLLYGVTGMAICLFCIGLVFQMNWTDGPWVLIFILGYIASFAASLGPIPWVMISEIFPTKTRGVAMSMAVLILWIAVYLVTQFFPILLESIGGAYTFWLFMINAVILLIFVWRIVPETKGKTLEEIERSWKEGI